LGGVELGDLIFFGLEIEREDQVAFVVGVPGRSLKSPVRRASSLVSSS